MTPTRRSSAPSLGITVAAVTAAGLAAAAAALQVALAAGAPFGAHVWGDTTDTAVLPPGLRIGSGVAALILVWMAAVVLARADLIATSPVPRRWLARTTWAIAAAMALNTMANLASTSAIERYGFGLSTAAIAAATAVVASRRPGVEPQGRGQVTDAAGRRLATRTTAGGPEAAAEIGRGDSTP